MSACTAIGGTANDGRLLDRPDTPGDGAEMPDSQLGLLLKVSAALTSTLDLAEVLQIAVESAVEVLGLHTGAIYTIDNDVLYLGATTPALPPDFPSELRFAMVPDHPHIERCVCTADPIYVADSALVEWSPAEQVAVTARELVTVLYVPLLSKGVAVGVMILGSHEAPVDFEGAHIDLCRTLSNEIAMAVTNAQLYDGVMHAKAQLESAYDATIEGWSLALEMRDEGTAGHTSRVTDLTLAVAGKMGIPAAQMPHIRRGALLHDIGKMAVPDAVLHKPGPLDDAEWELMRAHPTRAKEFLEQIEYLEPALEIPYCHHERWDGSGYPQGLSGEEIPLSARIFAIIDVLDALTSDRPYRPAWSRDAALAHIREQAGVHFDPAAVDAFFEVVSGNI